MILCLSLLALLGGVFSIKASSLFALYEEREETKKLSSLIEMAKFHSSAFRTDVVLFFQKERGCWKVGLSSDEIALLSKKEYQRTLVFRKLQAVEGLHEKEGKSYLTFLSSGWIDPLEGFSVNIGGKKKKIRPLG